MLQLYYFGKLEQQLGVSGEQISLLAEVKTVGQLQDWLKQHHDAWQTLDSKVIHSAVNHSHATPDTPLCDGDEVAFFSPIQGG